MEKLQNCVRRFVFPFRTPIESQPSHPPSNISLPPSNPSQMKPPPREKTHTLAAQRVTFLPSFIQSISPVPCASVLQTMKSSLNALQRAPMKKDALSSGAELEPTSGTLGMWSGSGVVSRSFVWLNLFRGGERGVSWMGCGGICGGGGIGGLRGRRIGGGDICTLVGERPFLGVWRWEFWINGGWGWVEMVDRQD